MGFTKLILLFTVAYIANGHSLNIGTTDSNSTDITIEPVKFEDISTDFPINSAKFDGNLTETILTEPVYLSDNGTDVSTEFHLLTSMTSFETKVSTESVCVVPSNPQPVASDCREFYNKGYYNDGVYNILVGDQVVRVWCDMTDRGWIVLQKRYDGSLDYAKSFNEYAEGFGDLSQEFWIGLNTMSLLTQTKSWTLRFDLETFNGETAWAEYSDFRIDPGTDFTLWFDQSSYRGTAGDSLHKQHEMKFSTAEFDQDINSGSCAEMWVGGWWYYKCMQSLTTGMPYGGDNTIIWFTWKEHEGLKAVTMKMIST